MATDCWQQDANIDKRPKNYNTGRKKGMASKDINNANTNINILLIGCNEFIFGTQDILSSDQDVFIIGLGKTGNTIVYEVGITNKN